ncbi:MAG: response regulator transcription factor [Bacteroidia bacterium]|nr:response regulator transcription factor [Bacteroidia bacterium]
MKHPINAIIVDDEPLARQLIKKFLEAWPEIEIIQECSDGFEAYKVLSENHCDLMFLDIQMPRINGFELLEIIDNPPLIIFSTAHDEYAIRAFEQNAVDYLLKPYTADRFQKAVNKALEKFIAGEKQNKLLNEANQKPDHFLNRIVVKEGSRVEILPVDTLHYLEAADDYVVIRADKGQFVKQRTMKFYTTHLDNEWFIRVHRSYIVNIDQIERIEPYSKESYHIVMKNGDLIPASRSGYKALRERLHF